MSEEVYGFDRPWLTANGRWVRPDAMVELAPAVVATELGLSVDEYLAAAEQWANGLGLPFGITVDRERGTVERVLPT